MIINWKKKNAGLLTISSISKSGDILKTISLLPGHNEVEDSDWENIKGQLKDKIENDLIEVIEIKDVKEVEVDGKLKKKAVNRTKLTEIPAVQAVEIISETYDLKTLRGWRKVEGRDEIRAVLAEQILAVEKPKVKGKKQK